MSFNFTKLFFVVNTSVQAPTSLIVSNAPIETNYNITSNMVKYIKYNDFNDWSTIPWNSAYFDIDQPDLKLVSATVIGETPNVRYDLTLRSFVVGEIDTVIRNLKGVYTLDSQQLNDLSMILFNHNFVPPNSVNSLFLQKHEFGTDYRLNLTFEIIKPLSFYIQSFMFYFSFDYFNNFTADYVFSFLDFQGAVKYNFNGRVDNVTYKQDFYNFVTMPVRVPNLKHLTLNFHIFGSPRDMAIIRIGQTNIFSAQDINPVPSISPFNPDYERASWYDIFAQLRNAFRWLLYGGVGKVLLVEPLREFFVKLDGLLRRIFDDTISSVLNVDFTSGLEQVLTLWVFLKAVGFLVG